MKSSNNGTGAKTVEAATSNDGTGATVESSSEAAAVKTAAAHGHAAAVEATATKAATTVSAATTATTATAAASTATSACLCARRKQRPGKQGGCQYHRCSSCSHEFSFRWAGAIVIIELPARPHIVAQLRMANGKFRRQ
jgi:hypothetical protein